MQWKKLHCTITFSKTILCDIRFWYSQIIFSTKPSAMSSNNWPLYPFIRLARQMSFITRSRHNKQRGWCSWYWSLPFNSIRDFPESLLYFGITDMVWSIIHRGYCLSMVIKQEYSSQYYLEHLHNHSTVWNTRFTIPEGAKWVPHYTVLCEKFGLPMNAWEHAHWWIIFKLITGEYTHD